MGGAYHPTGRPDKDGCSSSTCHHSQFNHFSRRLRGRLLRARDGFATTQTTRRLDEMGLKPPHKAARDLKAPLAEGVGFEPTRERNPLPVFKTGALNHSAILP